MVGNALPSPKRFPPSGPGFADDENPFCRNKALRCFAAFQPEALPLGGLVRVGLVLASAWPVKSKRFGQGTLGAAGPGVMTWLKEGSASTLKSSLAAGTAFNIEAFRPAPAEASGWGFIQRHDRGASLETVFLKGSAPLCRISKTAAAGEALRAAGAASAQRIRFLSKALRWLPLF